MGAVIILVVGGLLSAMLILPRQREMRRHNALVASLAVGDQVMTGSGIYGTITELRGDLAWLEIAPGVVIQVARRAIASTVAEPAASQEPETSASGTIDLDQLGPVDHDADGLAG
jgi:preprotein translocase subunit YajC